MVVFIKEILRLMMQDPEVPLVPIPQIRNLLEKEFGNSAPKSKESLRKYLREHEPDAFGSLYDEASLFQ